MIKPNIELKEILCPIDFSKQSYEALQYAVTLAKQFNASIHVVHALNFYNTNAVLINSWDEQFSIEKIEHFTNDELKRLCEEHIPSTIKNQFSVILDDVPSTAIADYARDNNIDLIVIGAHELNSLENMIVGSMVDKIKKKAPCHVLAIKDPKQDIVVNFFKKILSLKSKRSKKISL